MHDHCRTAGFAVCLWALAVAPAARAEDAGSVDHALPASMEPVKTGSTGNDAAPAASPDTASPVIPLSAVGRSIREAFTPAPIPEGTEPVQDPRLTSYPATPEDAALLSEQRDQKALAEFYAARNDAPLWVSKAGLEPRALSVIAEFKRSAYWGLDPKAFDVPSLPAASDGGPEIPEPDLIAAERTMALSVLKYARYARGGAIAQPDRQLSSFYDRRPAVRDRKQVLDDIAAATDAGAYLASLQPKHEQFVKLHQAWLEAKRTQSGKIAKLSGPDLKPGETSPQTTLLRKRMGLTPAPGADEALYDEELASAVRGFQVLRSLATTDGTVDAATRDALAKPIKANADQLYANMQAWRFMPEDLGKFYVWVNVPEYMIRIVKDGEVIWTERVTTGLVNKQTPIFDDEMEKVTFKSKWRVPDSIKVKEVWPSLLHGGGLMRQHGLTFETKDGTPVDWHAINWSKANMEDYTLWQPPGPKNQLGIVKFSFPSRHTVFMHDTPDKHMFNWGRRAVSHGCMRIRNPLEMATLILEKDQGWDRAKVNDAVKNGPEHNEIELKEKIPVHITYFTARVGDGGKIETWPDIYGHEKRMTLALAGKWKQINVPPNHLAPLDQARAPVVASGASRPAPQKADEGVFGLVSSALGGF